MPTPTQPWLRAELIAAPETAPGAQLMIPADGVEFHDDRLVFHHQGDIVYVASQDQIRSITWLARQPDPATARRRAQWPNHGTRWTDEEREDLFRRLQTGQSWKTISTAHGRSRSGCQQEAVKQGWLDADTLRLKPELSEHPESDPANPADDAHETPAALVPVPGHTAGGATDSTANRDGSPPLARHATPSGTTEASAPRALAEPVVSSSTPPPPDVPFGPPPPGPAGAQPAVPYVLSHQPAGPPVPDEVTSPLTAEATSPTPDRPRFPPRVPRQRTNPDNLPSPETGPDSEPGPESGPRPGPRFLSRAQSSLARATLGAYMNPPRGDSGLAAEAT